MDLIENWGVSNDCSFSDQRYLEFSLRKKPNKCETFLIRGKSWWRKQNAILTNLLRNKATISSIDDIEKAVSKLSESFRTTTRYPLYSLKTEGHEYTIMMVLPL